MYKKALVAVDNSADSNAAIDLATRLGSALGSTLVGFHVYAARLHEGRFRQMEPFLPPRYQEPPQLQRQRGIHRNLISDGLRLIAESYLDQFQARCQGREVPWERKLAEGRHYVEILKELRRDHYDLVAVGALGLGAVKESLLGSVCERILRRAPTDVLVGRSNDNAASSRIVVAIDGSPVSFEALRRALLLGKALGNPVEAVAAYDPRFHGTAFSSIIQVLPKEVAQRFRFRDQVHLHEEIIDRGLEKVYGSYLEAARGLAAQLNTGLTTALLAGKPFQEVWRYLEQAPTFLLVLGRSGRHRTRYAEVGSTTENLVRLARCHVLVVNASGGPRKAAPSGKA